MVENDLVSDGIDSTSTSSGRAEDLSFFYRRIILVGLSFVKKSPNVFPCMQTKSCFASASSKDSSGQAIEVINIAKGPAMIFLFDATAFEDTQILNDSCVESRVRCHGNDDTVVDECPRGPQVQTKVDKISCRAYNMLRNVRHEEFRTRMTTLLPAILGSSSCSGER